MGEHEIIFRYLYVAKDGLNVLRIEKSFKRFPKVLQKCGGRFECMLC